VRLRTSGDLTKGCNVDGQGNLACTGTVSADGGVAIGPHLDLPGSLRVGSGVTVGDGGLAVAGSVALGAGAVADAPSAHAIGATARTLGKWGSIVIAAGFAGSPILGSTTDLELVLGGRSGVRLRAGDAYAHECRLSEQGRLSCDRGIGLTSSIEHRTSQSQVVGGASSRVAWMTCTSDKVVVGGGVETGGADIKVRQAYPDVANNRFYAEVRNDNPFDDGWVKVHATCMLR
jgi:hypothetical protein